MVLQGHQDPVKALSLFHNDRLLASGSWDETARLWNLDTGLAVGSLLHHEDNVDGAAISADGKLLITSCWDNNAYVWNIDIILKEAGLEDLQSILDVPRDELEQETDAARRPAQIEHARRLQRGFFDSRDGVHSSAMPSTHPHSSTRPRALAPSSASRPYAFLSRFSSFFYHSQPNNTRESIEHQHSQSRNIASQHSPSPVKVAVVRDKQALYVTRRPERVSDQAKRIKDPTWRTRCILFICCIFARDANGA
ncbi:WD40 repeat-like protein [Rhizopogon salebrosus TDB-379]|nr:WD40 repeat-like protein [Rhizopogon salebrosus TDB-379]